MKRNLFRTVVMITVAIMLLSNMFIFADSNYIGANTKLVSKNANKEYVIKGVITEIKNDVITLGESTPKFSFKITNKTTILNAKDTKINKTDLKKGMNIEIVYKKVLNDKNDKINEAISIKIVSDTTQVYSALIKQITTNAKHSKITILYETKDSKNRIIENEFVIIADKDTLIYNQYGEIIKLSSLKKDMIIDIELSNEISINQYAMKISIVKNEEDVKITETVILDRYIEDNEMYVLTGDASNVSKQILFVLSKVVDIYDQFGNTVEFNELGKGQKIKVEHTSDMSKSLPPQCLAYSIQVLNYQDVNLIENAVVKEIDELSKTERLVTVTYNTTTSTKRVVENEMCLIVDNDTVVENIYKENVDKSVLKVGMVVDIEHSEAVTRSIPPQAYAFRISIVQVAENTQTTETKIVDRYTKNNKLYILTGEVNNVAKQILFVLSDGAVIKNQYGKNIKFNNLVVGQKIKVEHSKVMTRSLPPQCTAYSVQVVDNTNIMTLKDASIIAIDYYSNTITVSYELKVGKKTHEYTLCLVVDKNTVLKDKNNKALKFNDLKLDMVVDAEYELSATLSSPPKALAYKIVVKDYATEKPPVDEDDCVIYNLMIQLFLETDTEDWINCINNHSHDWSVFFGDDCEEFIEELFEYMLDDKIDEDDLEDWFKKIFSNGRFRYRNFDRDDD